MKVRGVLEASRSWHSMALVANVAPSASKLMLAVAVNVMVLIEFK